jgi:hypothetical protein
MKRQDVKKTNPLNHFANEKHRAPQPLMQSRFAMEIEVFGTENEQSKQLVAAVRKAAQEFGKPYELIRITDMRIMINLPHIAMLPALAIDGKVKSMGVIPSVDEIKKFFKETQGKQP